MEKKLGIDYGAAFRDNRLARAGVFPSGVSPNHRTFDRIATAHGAYWLSYDAASGEGRRETSLYPLGPLLADHPFPQQAFLHDGSAALFNLPNGLQAYAAFDADGKRLAAVGRELLRDPHRTAGSPVVVPGLSCIGCHKLGPVRFADDLRLRGQVAGVARTKLEQLVPRQEVLDGLFAEDENRYLDALRAAAGVFPIQGQDRERTLRDLPEPIAEVARMYRADLTLEQAGLELGLQDPSVLKEQILSDPNLQKQGLAPLAEGRPLRRGVWDNVEGRMYSPFHDCAEALQRGQPHRVR